LLVLIEDNVLAACQGRSAKARVARRIDMVGRFELGIGVKVGGL
jgi:hypothetical protein